MITVRVLVVTASRHGATAEMGQWIADTLRSHARSTGLALDVTTADAAADPIIAEADAVILGSGVYFGMWLPAARRLVARQQDSLMERPVWLFSSGPVDQDDNKRSPTKSRWDDVDWARDHHTFGGRLDRSVLGPMERLVVRMIGARDSDDRQREDVEEWTRSIASDLTAIRHHR